MQNQRLGLIILFSTNCKTTITLSLLHTHTHTHTHKHALMHIQPSPSLPLSPQLSQSVAESHFTLKCMPVYWVIKISKKREQWRRRDKKDERQVETKMVRKTGERDGEGERARQKLGMEDVGEKEEGGIRCATAS